MENELILLSEYLENTHADLEFILLLEEEGLIETHEYNKSKFLHSSQLGDLERFVHLHYDLSVNIEGIDIINNLLNEMQAIRDELNALRRQINLEMDDFFDDTFFEE